MATNFPGSLDNATSLPYPTAVNGRNAPSLAQGQDNQNDAVIATETKLGTGASTPTNNNLLIGTGTGTSAWTKAAPTGAIVGTTDSQTLTNKTLTSPTINSPVITNATITADSITGFTTSNTGTIYGVAITAGSISGANTVNGSSLIAASVPASAIVAGSITSTQIAANGIGAASLSTTAITIGKTSSFTSFSTSSTTDVQATGATLTVTIPSTGRDVEVMLDNIVMTNSSATAYTTISLWDGTVGSGTLIARKYWIASVAGGFQGASLCAHYNPSPGSHTYNVGVAVQTGTGGYNTYAGQILTVKLA